MGIEAPQQGSACGRMRSGQQQCSVEGPSSPGQMCSLQTVCVFEIQPL